MLEFFLLILMVGLFAAGLVAVEGIALFCCWIWALRRKYFPRRKSHQTPQGLYLRPWKGE